MGKSMRKLIDAPFTNETYFKLKNFCFCQHQTPFLLYFLGNNNETSSLNKHN